jgi:hypothetical protein
VAQLDDNADREPAQPDEQDDRRVPRGGVVHRQGADRQRGRARERGSRERGTRPAEHGTPAEPERVGRPPRQRRTGAPVDPPHPSSTDSAATNPTTSAVNTSSNQRRSPDPSAMPPV